MQKITLPYILLLAVLFTVACNRNKPPTTLDGYEAIVVEEGQHQSHPWPLVLTKKDHTYSWYFSNSARYYINQDSSWSGDQKDWNKLIGQSYTPYQLWTNANHINSAMVGWRWNTHHDYMELNAYFHIDEARQYTSPILSVEIGQKFETSITRNNNNTVTVRVEKFTDPDNPNFSAGIGEFTADFFDENIPDEIREINTYFGGNRTAPKRIIIYKKRI